MKKIFTYFIGVLLISACTVDGLENNTYDNGLVTLELKTLGSVKSKAATTMDGEDKFNENLISEIHYYIYTDASAKSIINKTQNIDATEEAKIALAINQTEYATIFNGRTEATIYVVANPGETLGTGQKTISEIEATAFEIADGIQSNFIMTGSGTLTKTTSGDTYKASGSVELTRRIAKITLKFKVEDSYTDSQENTWTPVPEDIKAVINNLASDGIYEGINEDSDKFNKEFIVKKNEFKITEATATTPIICTLQTPVYTCARNWEVSDSDKPYIDVTLPWVKQNSSEKTNTYYKVVFNGNNFDQNKWYDITVELSGLGSMSQTNTIEVTPTFNIADWNTTSGSATTNNDTEAEIEDVRILALERNNYTMNNVNTIVIPFKSTHDCEIKGNVSIISNRDASIAGTGKTCTATINNTDKTITVTHDLVNNQTNTPYDYTPYTITFTIRHINNDNFKQTVTITQYPALSVEYTENTNGTNSGAQTVFVDGLERDEDPYTGTTSDNTGTYYRWFGGNHSEYSLRVHDITVTTLDGVTLSLKDSDNKTVTIDYIIGDPRVRTNMMGKDAFVNTEGFPQTSAKNIDGTPNWTLKYYYPADDTADNIIAPKLKVASGWCSGGMSIARAKRKCATYQEAGYPAGRWRLPTEAELVYIAKLQADGYIGKILSSTGNGGHYMGSNGIVYIIKGSTLTKSNETSASFRCVYDAWYWDNTEYPRLEGTAKNDFTWGDALVY